MRTLKIIQSLLLTLLGSVTVFLTLSILFDVFGIREKEGHYVLFIIYANLACGILYLYAAYANWKNQKYSNYSLVLATLILIIAFIFLLTYINDGGIYEKKTVKAMIFRMAFTMVMLLAGLYISKKSINNKSYKKLK